ncbi:MAG: class I SAM-dependent methyltransferase [Candidatus Electrothrix sp. AUS1_2]|nr:class I SAM-dependent methyltransferase [Candidatus Electrothrix sp. AUS1_2]
MGLFSPTIKEYISTIQHLASGRMLDVGCGDKPYYDQFNNVTEYIGIDIPPEVDIERLNAAKRKNVVDVYGNGQTLPFRDGSFDSVLTTQVIAHLTDPFLFISEISRVMKDGGVLIITYPMISPLFEIPHEYFRYTEYGIADLCNRFNMSIIKHEKMGGGWLAIGFLMRHFLFQNHYNCDNLLVKKIYFSLAVRLYSFFSWLDKINKQPDTPLNYLTVAQKTYSK